MVLDLLLSTLIGSTAGRVFLKVTRFWINSAIRRITSTTKIEWKQNPYVITGVGYPNILLPLRVISKTNIELTLEQIKAEANFGGLNVGVLYWFQDQDGTIERKKDKEVIIEFVPPLQVFLLNLAKCCLLNGIAELNCSFGKVIVPFSTDSCEVDDFEQGIKTVRDLLSSK